MATPARTILSLKRFAELCLEQKKPTRAELGNVAVRSPVQLVVSRSDTSDENAPVTFDISDESVDRYDSTLALDGWKLENYRKNPVVCWAHNTYSEPPIGRSVEIGVVGKKLRASVEFVSRDVFPFAAMIRAMVVRGFLNAASVSWDPLKWVYNEGRGYYAIDYLEMDLMEWSIVPVPGNPNTLAEARAAGIDLDPLAGWAEKHLDDLVGRELSAEERTRVARLEALRRHAGRTSRPFVDLGAVPELAGDDGVLARMTAAAERLERAAAGLETLAKTPTGIVEVSGDQLATAIAASARAATKDYVRSTTGRLD